MTASLLSAARNGDERAFVQLTAPHREELHRHCYRLLGSLHDADDAVQETMLRAWQGIGRFQPRAPLRAWLYRIATNVCLRQIERRGRQERSAAITHLEPYPDTDEARAPEEAGPAAIVEAHEAIGLAFVAAMQLLPGRQRAVLVLRDVLGWPARDVASLLDDTVPAVNSALQRARERLDSGRTEGIVGRRHRPGDAEVDGALVRRFIEAWEAADIERLVALLESDAVLSMPPEDVRIVGAENVGAFFATQPLAGRLDKIPLLVTTANGQPALAAYADEHGIGVAEPYGMMVLSIDNGKICAITGFPRRPDLFARLGLPAQGPPAGRAD
jgi:RNA polymerase sigma-70 factor (ECF subfamily)